MNTFVYIDLKPNHEPFYVGIGNSRRVRNPRRNGLHTNIRVKYPNWQRVVVETATRSLCEELECFIIEELGRRDLGTGPLSNLTSGGEGSPNTVVSVETRTKLSDALRGIVKTTEWRSRIGAANKGRVRSPETKLRYKEASSGRTHSEETKRKVSESSLAMWEDLDRRKAHSDKIRAKWASAEYKEHLRETHRVRQSNPEFKASMSAKVSLAWQDQTLCKTQSDRVKGLIWVTDGNVAKRVVSDKIEALLALGWKRGRK